MPGLTTNYAVLGIAIVIPGLAEAKPSDRRADNLPYLYCTAEGIIAQGDKYVFLCAIMNTGRTAPLAAKISCAAALCLVLGGLWVIGCGHPASDLTASSSPTSSLEATIAGVVLHANPNPIPGGTDMGETTITWRADSGSMAEVYVVRADGKEQLFAAGSNGSEKAPWIQPGSTEFRLYREGDHKLLARLTVIMADDAPLSSPSATPVSSPSP